MKEQIKELHNKGLSLNKISKELHISVSKVRYLLQQHNNTIPLQQHSNKDLLQQHNKEVSLQQHSKDIELKTIKEDIIAINQSIADIKLILLGHKQELNNLSLGIEEELNKQAYKLNSVCNGLIEEVNFKISEVMRK